MQKCKNKNIFCCFNNGKLSYDFMHAFKNRVKIVKKKKKKTKNIDKSIPTCSEKPSFKDYHLDMS